MNHYIYIYIFVGKTKETERGLVVVISNCNVVTHRTEGKQKSMIRRDDAIQLIDIHM